MLEQFYHNALEGAYIQREQIKHQLYQAKRAGTELTYDLVLDLIRGSVDQVERTTLVMATPPDGWVENEVEDV